MVMLSEVLGIVISLIVFIFLVSVFFNIFGSTECEGFANATAKNLKSAIEDVALGEDVYSWAGEGVPPDEAEDYYAIVPIKLCEEGLESTIDVTVPFIGTKLLEKKISGVGAALGAQTPTYVIVYETFPEDSLGWSETQPWGGGAVSAALFYGALVYGPKILAVGKIGLKIVKGLAHIPGDVAQGTFGIKAWIKLDKVSKWLDNRLVVKGIKRVLKSIHASETVSSVQKGRIEKRIDDIMTKKLNSAQQEIFNNWKTGNLEDVQAALGTFAASKIDPNTLKKASEIVTETVDGAKSYKYVVKDEFRDTVNLLIATSNEGTAKMLKETFYIPSKYGWVEKVKKFWYPAKYEIGKWAKNRAIYKVVSKMQDVYVKLKNNYWNRVFNNKKYIDSFDTPQKAGAYKGWALKNFPDFRSHVENNFDVFGGAISDVTGRAIKNADELTDPDLYKFLTVYEKYFNSQTLIEFAVKQSDTALVTHAAQNMGNFLKDEANDIVKKGGKTSFKELQNLFPDRWENLLPGQKEDWLKTMMDGDDWKKLDFNYAGLIYTDTRANLLREGALDSSKMLTTSGEILNSKFTKAMENVRGKLYTAPLMRSELRDIAMKEGLNDFYSPKIVTSSVFGSGAWNKMVAEGKSFIFLDMERVGGGLLSALSPFGARSAREAIDRTTEITEGGCAPNSICAITEGSPTPYLLDDKVKENVESDIAVKLWRPNPDWTQRTPIGISTLMMYMSVKENPRFYVASPCFAVAKVWYSDRDGVIYVDIDKTKKCDVSDCETGIDTPNYCYADEEYIWGENYDDKFFDDPSELEYLTGLAACTITCGAFSAGTTTMQCLRSCAYLEIGVLFLDATLKTQDYKDVPSWQRQETGWGYWNYVKANDMCDLLDNIANLAGRGIAKSVAKAEGISYSNAVKSIAESTGGFSKFAKSRVNDLCFGLTMIGDSSLAWPIKVPVIEITRKGTPLNVDCMEQTAAECIWINKCELGKNQCSINQECIRGVCQTE